MQKTNNRSWLLQDLDGSRNRAMRQCGTKRSLDLPHYPITMSLAEVYFTAIVTVPAALVVVPLVTLYVNESVPTKSLVGV